MKTHIFLFVFLIPLISISQDFEYIKEDLIKIIERNTELRGSVYPTVQKYGWGSAQMDSLDQLINYFDSVSLTKVVEIIDQHGWMGISQIGEVSNSALFMTIQHAKNKEIRVKYFPLLKASAEVGESTLSSMATMHDRVLIESGEKQLYGTQSKMVNNELVHFPIEDSEHVNERRRKVGLDALE